MHLRQNEIRKILEHPFLFLHSIDDAERLASHLNAGPARTRPAFDTLVKPLQVRAVVGSDQH